MCWATKAGAIHRPLTFVFSSLTGAGRPEEAAVCFWHHRSGHLWLLGYLFSCLFLMAVWVWPCVRSPVFAPVLQAQPPSRSLWLPVASSFQPLVRVSSRCGETCAVTDNGVQQGGGGLGMKGHAAPSPVAARTSCGVQGPRSPSLMAPEGRDAGQLTRGGGWLCSRDLFMADGGKKGEQCGER